MRKGDLELLEMRLEPHARAIDRLTTDLSEAQRTISTLRDQVKDIQRNDEVRKTEMAQGLASIRSLLQRANKVSREVGIVDEEEVVDRPGKPVNVEAHNDSRLRAIRRNVDGRTVL